MLIAVILFWLSILAYIPYHFRNCEPVRHFFAGFTSMWLSLVQADDKVAEAEGEAMDAGEEDAFQLGIGVAMCSVVVVVLVILGIAIYTIYLAC